MNKLGNMLVLFVALGLLAGCGGPPRAKLQGKVTLDGKPITNGLMDFLPEGGNGQTAGTSIVQGAYSLELAPGKYQVKITSAVVVGREKAYDTPDSPIIEKVENNVPAKYNTKTELSVELTAGDNSKDFELQGAMPTPKAP